MEMVQEDETTDVDLNDMSHWSPNVQKTIMELQQVAGTARHYLSKMHFALTLLKSQVSESDFNKIYKSIKPPSTVINIVRSLTGPTGPSNVAPAQPPPSGSQTHNVDQQIMTTCQGQTTSLMSGNQQAY